MFSVVTNSHHIGRRRFQAKRFVAVGVSCLMTLWTGSLSSPMQAQTYTIAQRIANPSYFVPGPLWTQLSQSAPFVGIAVANVINGPDYLPNPDYVSAIKAANAAGTKVLGYVRTGYFGSTGFTTRLGQTDVASWLAQIEQDVNAWYNFYGSAGLAGIFFDEAQNACGNNNMYANLYSFISAYVKQNHTGAVVAENPGTSVPPCFQGTADIILTFEGTYLCYIGHASCPAGQKYTELTWNPGDPHAIWHLVYDTSSDQFSNASALTKARRAGWFYITPDILPNPWDSLPTGDDWSAEEGATTATGGDTDAPSTPTRLTSPSSGVDYTSAALNWTASSDSGSGVVAYDVYQNGGWILSTPATAASTQAVTLTGLVPGTPYSFSISARDASDNVSPPSSAYSLTTKAPNGIVPTAPGNLTTSQITYSSVTLSWSAAADSLGISAYDVYKEGTKILTLNGSTSSVLVGGLSPGTPSAFFVQARDSQGNVSASSNTAGVTTLSLSLEGAISNAAGAISKPWARYSADFNLAFGFQHVLIDTDNNPGTGWVTSSSPSIGADYLIENGTLYQYAGSGTDWTWTMVDTITPRVKGYNVSWKVPVSDFINPAPTQSVVFNGTGFAPNSYSSVLTLGQ